MQPKPKLMIVGHGRHGKDSVCEILRDQYGYTFMSSSEFVGRKAVFPTAQDREHFLTEKYSVPRYDTFDQCFADRHNYRGFWWESIKRYNTPDLARLGKELYAEFDLYCGLRDDEELSALTRALPITIIWVDRSQRLPPESAASMKITRSMADHVIDNNGTLDDLYAEVDALMYRLRIPKIMIKWTTIGDASQRVVKQLEADRG